MSTPEEFKTREQVHDEILAAWDERGCQVMYELAGGLGHNVVNHAHRGKLEVELVVLLSNLEHRIQMLEQVVQP